jgi:hypothetical protein
MDRDCSEFFTRKNNAKVWPSDDPKDRPSFTYICKLCGKEIIVPYSVPNRVLDNHINTHYLRYLNIIE